MSSRLWYYVMLAAIAMVCGDDCSASVLETFQDPKLRETDNEDQRQGIPDDIIIQHTIPLMICVTLLHLL